LSCSTAFVVKPFAQPSASPTFVFPASFLTALIRSCNSVWRLHVHSVDPACAVPRLNVRAARKLLPPECLTNLPYRPLTGWVERPATAWIKSLRHLRSGQILPRFYSPDTVLLFFPGCFHPESASSCCQPSAHFRLELLPAPLGCRSFPGSRRLAPVVTSGDLATLRSSLRPCDHRRFRLVVPPSHSRSEHQTCAQRHSATSRTATNSLMRLSSHLCRPFSVLKLSAGLRVRNSLAATSYLNPAAGLKRRLPSI